MSCVSTSEDALSFDKVPIGLRIDNGFDNTNGGKCIFISNATGMASFCCCAKRKPLYVKEIIDNFKKLIDELDIVFYNKLLNECVRDPNRPSGTIASIKDFK